MARPDNLRFSIPTPYAWSADKPADGIDPDRVEVELTPAAGKSFTFTTIVTVKGTSDDNEQWYWQFSGSLQAQIIFWVNGSQIASGKKAVALNASLELARSKQDNSDRLLRGSLSLPIDPFDDVDWRDKLQQLWPTNELTDIAQLRIEPTGLFILGNLPEQFFPTPTPVERRVVLRVPQLESDVVSEILITFFSRQGGSLSPNQLVKAKQRLWTLLSFPFLDELADKFTKLEQNADKIIRAHVTALPLETPTLPTFLDSSECEPQTDCKILITATSDGIYWWAEGIGTRLAIAAPQTNNPLQVRPEATFYPAFLTGSLTQTMGGAWQSQPVALIDGASQGSKELIQLDIELKKTPSVSFSFAKRDLAAIAIPTTLLQDAKGLLKVGTLGKEKKSISIQRAWLCMETGWLSLDTLEPQSRLSTELESSKSTSGLASVLPLSQIVDALNTKEDNEALSGMKIELEALRDSFVAIVYQQPFLTLWIEHPKVILQTPRVWYQTPNTDVELLQPETDISNDVAQPRTQRPVPETLVPSLTVLTDASNTNKESLEIGLNEILLSATFVSTNALDIGTDLVEDTPQTLQSSIQFDNINKKFVFEWSNGKGMRLWHYSEGYPLVQTVPLSPAASRDRFLDANRGLIPYERRDLAAPVKLDFPQNGLARVSENVPLSDGINLTGSAWQISAKFSNQRFFLPTLPGVEMQPAEAGAKQPWDWFYRHAVPALDEAYTEVVETSNDEGKGKTVPVELTRVRESIAFKLFPQTFEERQAKGWLPKTLKNQGVTPITIESVVLKGRQPEFKFKLDSIGQSFTFQRPAFGDPSAIATLTQALKVSLDCDCQDVPQFEVDWSTTNLPNTPSLVNNGQPLVALWSKTRERVLTLDAEGVVKEEPSGVTIQEWQLDKSPHQFRIQTIQLGDQDTVLDTKLQLDLAEIEIQLDIGDQDTVLDTKLQLDPAEIEIQLDKTRDGLDGERGQWMLHNGSGSWPVWRGFYLFPTALDLQKQGTNLIVSVEAILLWQSKSYLEKVNPEQLAQLAATSTGLITLTFKGADDINPSLTLNGVRGSIDWRFQENLDDPFPKIDLREANVKDVTLLRIKAEFDDKQDADKQDAAKHELKMILQEVGLKHPIGVLRLRPDNELPETICQLSNGLLKFSAKRVTGEFAYSIPEISIGSRAPEGDTANPTSTEYAPPLPSGWEFSWQNKAVSQAPNWQLQHLSQDKSQDNKWRFRLEQDGADLTGDLALILNQVGPRQFMFQVLGEQYTSLPSEESWFRIDDTAPKGGFVGVEFAPSAKPSEKESPEIRVTDITAEIQIFFTDREPYTQDAIHLYAPETEELESFDQGTGIVQELQVDLSTEKYPDLRAFPGVGAISIGDDQIFWCSEGEVKVRRWQRNFNVVDSRINKGAATVQITRPRISDSPPEKDFQPQFLILLDSLEAQAIAINSNQELLFWDLNDPDQSRRDSTGKLLKNPIDSSREPILAIAARQQKFRNADEYIVWSRKTPTPSQSYFLRVWKLADNPATPPTNEANVTAHTGNITAIDFLPPQENKDWIVSGDVNGNIVIWDPEVTASNNIVQILVQNDGATETAVPVTALAVMAISTSLSSLIVSAGSDGVVRLWDELPEDIPVPSLVLEPIKRPLSQYLMAAKVKQLLPLSDTELAVLDEDGVVVILTIKDKRFVTRSSEDISEYKLPRILNLFGTVAKSISIVRLANEQRLLVVGQPPRTRLGGLLTLKKEKKGLEIDLSITGWLVLENKLQLSELINDLTTPPTPRKRTVTHRIRVFLDQAKLPLKAVYQGIGPEEEIFIAGIAEHTLRLSVGNRINKNLPSLDQIDPLQQVDRNWQVAQRLRLTTLDQYSQLFLKTSADPNKKELVIEAGAVFWLRWVNPSLSRRQTASEIFHPKLRIFFRPQEMGRFQIQDEANCLHLIRLPFASAVTKLPDQSFSIPDKEDPNEICHDSAGVQTALMEVPQDIRPQEVAYFRRTDALNARLRGTSRLQVKTFDSLWLQESFLNKILAPSPTGQISPEIEDGTLSDLDGLRIPPKPTSLNPGNIEKSRQQPVLAAATLTGFVYQVSPSLFEFPFQLLGSDKPPRLSSAIEIFRIPTKPLDDSYERTLCNAQLVVSFEGEFICLAREQLEISEEKLIQQMGGNPEAAKNQLKDDLEALKSAYRRGQIKQLLDLLAVPLPEARILEQQVKTLILNWAKRILAERRRSNGAFVLIDFTYVLLVPLGTDIFQEELRYAQSWSSQLLQVDPRSRFPRVIPTTIAAPIQLAPNPDLNLLLFAAKPVSPISPLPTIAATYFRLASTGTGDLQGNWFGKLRPAHMEVWENKAQTSTRCVLATTMREFVPFERYEGTNPFPRPDTRTQTERPVVEEVLAVMGADTLESFVETILPPLIDVVSWAARPGELTRTTWNLERTEFQDNLVKIGAAAGASATLRRPRAIAGQNQSVRLLTEEKNLLALNGDRFFYAQLELQQVLDRTGNNDFSDKGIYAVLATQSEIFRSFTTQARAVQSPALIYFTVNDGKLMLEDCKLYLLANEGFNPKPDPDKNRTRLLWAIDPSNLPKIPKSDIDFPSNGVILPNIDTGTWTKLPGSDSVSQPAEAPFSRTLLQSKRLELNQPPNKTLYLVIVHYILETTNGSPPVEEYVPTVWAAIAVGLLNTEGRLRAPKNSVSVLASPEKSPETTILAGYARLSNSDFSPIQPKASPNLSDPQQIEWLRTASLEVLHRRVGVKTKYSYDVVVYGSGGEVFPTEVQ
jgi:WD40 repeat protein